MAVATPPPPRVTAPTTNRYSLVPLHRHLGSLGGASLFAFFTDLPTVWHGMKSKEALAWSSPPRHRFCCWAGGRGGRVSSSYSSACRCLEGRRRSTQWDLNWHLQW